nr:MAG TPA: hypothetical protein [Caudoviricetes sp.]
MVVMPRQTIKRFLHFALCLAGVGRSIFPVSRVCFSRLILRGIGVRRFLFLRRCYERHKTQNRPSE